MKKKLSVALAAAMLAALPASAALADGHENPEITVVHGVPGAEGVFVLADGGELLSDFDYKDIVTTSDVPAGTYSIAVSTSDSVDDAVIGPVDLTFEAGGKYAVVAHLDTDGGLTASVFDVNTDEGISAFHTANFGPVAIIAGGDAAADDVANGDDAQLDLPAGTELPGVGIAAAGTTDVVIEVGDVTIPSEERILAFAVGGEGPLDAEAAVEVITTTVPANAIEVEEEDEADDAAEEEVEQPTHVDSGTGGLLDAGLPVWVAALMVMGALGIAAPAVATARRRS